MELFKRQPLLIGLLIMLLSIRFVIVPILDWQNESLEKIQGLQKKQQKTQIAIFREKINQAQAQNLEMQNKAFQNLFFTVSSEAKFKLEQQQWLEDLLIKHKLKVTNIGWLNSATVPNSKVIKHSLKLGFQGQTTNVPAFQSDLESTIEWIEVEGFKVALVDKSNQKVGRVRASYQLSFYQLISETEEEQ